MANTLSWKFREHSDLIKAGKRHNLILDFFSKEYRESNYRIWLSIPKQVASAKGFTFSDDTPSSALREIFVYENYNLQGFTPGKGESVVDVGANFGDSAVWWSKTFGSKVIAFEPMAKVFHILEENIKLNNAEVTAYNVALGNGDVISGNFDGNMFSSGGGLSIKSERLDDYSFERLDLLKIDVEGFELDVLKGAENTILKFKPKIIIETHSKELRKRCHEFLSSHGYKLMVEGRTVNSRAKGMDKVTNLFYSV